MPIQRSIPSERIIGGKLLKSSEIVFVTDKNYTTRGEALIVTKKIENIEILLDSATTDHVIIKALTQTKIKPIWGLIDEEFGEINIGKGASIELYFGFGNWYIVSSDGIKEEELHYLFPSLFCKFINVLRVNSSFFPIYLFLFCNSQKVINTILVCRLKRNPVN